MVHLWSNIWTKDMPLREIALTNIVESGMQKNVNKLFPQEGEQNWTMIQEYLTNLVLKRCLRGSSLLRSIQLKFV